MATNIKPEKEIEITDTYNPNEDELKVWTEYKERKKELIKSRDNVHGININEQMRRYDKDYFNRDADIPASELDPDQKPVAINNAFGKIQTALSILIAHNPDYFLEEMLQKYSANRELIKGLMKKSWQRTDSYWQFLLFVFNMAKRGWGVGRTYHKLIETKGRFRIEQSADGTVKYSDEKNFKKIDDIAFVNMDNHNCWIDEEARPFDFYSARDDMWREVWHIDKVRSVFPEKEFPNMKYVKEGGNVQERIEGGSSQQKETKKGMTELYFYEHQYSDRFVVEINDVMVVWEPLPQNHKRLSLLTAPWNLRSAETIYGLGVIEEMEKDETLIDRILNLDLRQLLLSIAPPGFYSGTEDFENENIKMKAGVLRRTLNPQDINFLKIPSPNPEGMNRIQWLESKEEQKTGITKTIEGDIQGIRKDEKAFALGISREAGMKRLSLPLKSLQYMLNWEARNRADLIKQVYSVFEVEHITNEEDIMKYIDEVKKDPSFYFIENEGVEGEEKFYAKKYRETQLNVERTEKGDFMEADNKKFFKIKPEWLPWEGDIWVDVKSMLTTSEELDKLDTLRMMNLIAPMLERPVAVVGKFVKQILSAFDKDPKKWLPDDWLEQLYPDIPSTTAKPAEPIGKEVVPAENLEMTPTLGKRMATGVQALNPFKWFK